MGEGGESGGEERDGEGEKDGIFFFLFLFGEETIPLGNYAFLIFHYY